MNYIRVTTTVVFDTLDTRLAAQTMLTKRLSSLSSTKTNFETVRMGLVQWSDPQTNEANTFSKNDKDYFRYTSVIECTYNAEDDYIVVQDDFIKLFKDDEDLFFNVQNIDAYISKVVTATTEETTDSTDEVTA